MYRYPATKAYFFDDFGRFGTKYMKGAMETIAWKSRVQKIRTYECDLCGTRYRSNMRRCPRCQ